MKGLLKKDLILLKQQKKYILIILLITMVVAYGNPQSAFISSYLTFLGSGLIFNSFSYDTYQHGLTYLFALPFSKKDYIKEKYFYSAIVTITFWLLGNLISLIFNQFIISKETLYSNLAILIIATLYLSVIIPIHIKYGREKSSMIIIIIALLISFVFIQFIDLKNISISIPLPSIMVGSLLIVIALCLFSYHKSISILNHKEL